MISRYCVLHSGGFLSALHEILGAQDSLAEGLLMEGMGGSGGFPLVSDSKDTTL